MPKLYLTVEIARDDEHSYRRVRDDLDDAIRAKIPDDRLWAGMSDTYIVLTAQAPRPFAKYLVEAAGLRHDRDRLLVLNSTGGTGAAWGARFPGKLLDLMPGVTLL